MKNILPKPKSIPFIIPMKLRFSFSKEKTPREWIKDDLFMSHFMNAMSLTFPDGERFFMDSVRQYRSIIKDEVLQKDIQGFLQQEAFHGNAHENFNKMLKEQGYPVDKIIGLVQALLDLVQDISDKNEKTQSIPLAITCGLEHITAILGNLLLTEHSLTKNMDNTVQSMWIWHAIEETEHKAVAYDVYSTVHQNYLERIGTFLVSSIMFILAVHAFQAMLLHVDNRNDLQTWTNGLKKLYGPQGYITSLIPGWFSYLKPGFHPWKEQDNSHLIKPWKLILLEKYKNA